MILRILSGLFLGGLFMTLEATVLPLLSVQGVVPGIHLLILVFFSFYYGSLEGVVIGFFLGLGLDIVWTGVLGYHALVYSIVGYLVGKGRGKVQLDLVLMPLLVFVLSWLVRWAVTLVSAFFLDLPQVYGRVFNLATLWEFLLSSILVVPLFLLLRILDRRVLSRSLYS